MTGFSALAAPADGGASRKALAGEARMAGPRWFRLPALTGGLLGVSVFWSVEMAYAPPYLLSLGVSKSHMALVFAAGPLSGLIVQPVVGMLSDSCKWRFGRRRPYIAFGTLLCVAAMLLLGFTRSIASVFAVPGSTSNDGLTIWLAVLAIYCVDFSINAVMGVDRTLIVDTLPTEDQVKGNAWATNMAVIGGVVGLYIGVVDLPKHLPWLCNTQLQGLALLASLLFFGTHAAAVAVVRERVLLPESEDGPKGLASEVRKLWQTGKTLPRIIHQIFAIQFFASIAWFPIFNYLTVYVSDLHTRATPAEASRDAAAMAARAAEGTRLGTRALFFSSLVSLLVMIVMPPFVVGSAGSSSSAPGVVERVMATLRLGKVPKVQLASLWAASLALFAACMFATVFVTEVSTATIIITITGISGAIGQWAPFALIGEAILLSSPASAEENIHMVDRREDGRLFDAAADVGERERFLAAGLDDSSDDGSEEDKEDRVALAPRADGFLGSAAARMSTLDVDVLGDLEASPSKSEVNDDLTAKAGVILGINNVFTVIPQFIVTALAAVIFALAEPAASNTSGGTSGGSVLAPGANSTAALMLSRAEDGTRNEGAAGANSVGLVFRVGGVSAAIACWLAWRLAGEFRRRSRE